MCVWRFVCTRVRARAGLDGEVCAFVAVSSGVYWCVHAQRVPPPALSVLAREGTLLPRRRRSNPFSPYGSWRFPPFLSLIEPSPLLRHHTFHRRVGDGKRRGESDAWCVRLCARTRVKVFVRQLCTAVGNMRMFICFGICVCVCARSWLCLYE